MSESPKIRIAIIGGGIVGLSLATGLLKHPHIDVRIYESTAVFSEIGAGLTVGPNARQALEMLGPNLSNAFKKTVTPNLWPDRRNNYMTHIIGYGPNAGYNIYTPQSRGGQQCVHRGKFLDEIAKGIPADRSYFNKRLVRIEEKNKVDPIVLHFADGTTEQADAVAGADGIHSFVRGYVIGEDHPARHPVYAESVTFRRIVPMELAIEKLGEEHAQNSTMLVGPGKALLTYPLNHGTAVNIVLQDYTCKSWEHEEWTHPISQEELRKVFEGWSAQAQAVVELVFTEPELLRWAIHDHLPAPTYYKGRVVLVGDSAHASTPYQGNGAAQGMEDALTMEALLGRTQKVAHVVKAFAAYDQIRRPRSQRVVATSRECGLILGMVHPDIGTDIDKMRDELATRFKWIWNRDLVAQNRAALELFDESIQPTVD